MHLKVLAFDLDGTLAVDGHVAPETWQALRKAKEHGFTLLLVTGRKLADFAAQGPFAEIFEAIVAEDGAAVYYPRNDSVTLPFGRLDPVVRGRLQELNIPLERGMAIAATWEPHDEAVLQVLKDTEGGATVEYNKGAVMVLPPGATKGTGLQSALHELGYSMRNVLACGDAQNDRSLFEVVECSVAVGDAAPEIKKLADVVLDDPDGKGVRGLIDLLAGGALPTRAPRPERRLMLGYRHEGEPVLMDPFTLFQGNLGIIGASASGKSFLAGLITEELLKLGYQVCVIDPEGDYRGLQAFPHTLLLGGQETQLPPVVDVVTLHEYTNVSLILDLSSYSIDDRLAYVEQLLYALAGLRSRRGRPHWFLIDEIQSFCPADDGGITDLVIDQMSNGGFGVVSYRSSQVSGKLLGAIDSWLITRLSLPEEVDLLRQHVPCDVQGTLEVGALDALSIGQVFMCPGEAPHASVTGTLTFQTARRVVPHVRHLHKYLRVPLPEPKRFYFHLQGETRAPRTAASLWEFNEALHQVPVDVLKYHLQRGDFERWVRDVLRDQELARRLRKLARRDMDGETLRQALVATVGDRYDELESLI